MAYALLPSQAGGEGFRDLDLAVYRGWKGKALGATCGAGGVASPRFSWKIWINSRGGRGGTRVSCDFLCRWEGRDESERHRAESQWIVAARPLFHLQYPVAYLSRLQRILPAARWELRFKASRKANLPYEDRPRHVPLGGRDPLLLVGKRTAGARVASSPDSDLEAFSHNPTHGSFAPLAFQPSAMTNCANQRFLSY